MTAILALGVWLLAGCAKPAEKETASTSPPQTAVVTSSTETSAPEAEATTNGQEESSSPASEAGEATATEEAPAPPTPPASPAAGSGGLASRALSDNQLTTKLETIARKLEAKKLAYVSELGQDCSGIYHQIKDSIQARIPALADQSKYIFPSFRDQRNSRQIADWYYRHNNLLIIQDPMAERNKIRPGSVMFFGRTDEHYPNIDIDLLSNPGKFVHDGVKGKIMHIAVVTSVEKDEAGNVVKYTIMHGRNKRYPASRSSGNYDGPGGFAKAFANFPFGNWNQQWVAMAHIETPR